MAKLLSRPMTIGILLSALAAGSVAGCEGSKASGPAGTGGGAGNDASVQGSGGSAGAGGAGGTMASGGGTGTSSGGIGSGGIGSGGAGTGGIGTGGKATGGIGAGGIGAGGVGAGGAGGKATGGTGAGGIGSGGILSLDAGNCIGAACPIDAQAVDTRPADTGASDAPLPSCTQLSTQTECEARGGCHAVFVDPGTCGCASQGCCAHFNRCADGAQANCTGPALCKAATPFCESPYVVGFTGTCYEGCVRQSVCAPPTCPQSPPADATSCGGVDYSCIYEDCANAGRTQATCTSGTWTVQTGACAAQACAGGGVSSGTITCAAGKICVRTTSGGGAYMITPTCVDNTCGTGPIMTKCLPSLPGTCYLIGSALSVQVSCSLPSSCGQGQGGCA